MIPEFYTADMKEYVYLVLGTLTGALLGAGSAIMLPNTPHFWIGELLVGLGFLVLIFPLFFLLSKKFWCGKEDWMLSFSSHIPSEDTIPQEGIKCDDWRSSGLQKPGDCLCLSIRKPSTGFRRFIFSIAPSVLRKYLNINGERVIDEIQFMQNARKYGASSYPLKYRVTIDGKGGILPEWNRRELSGEDLSNGILIKLEHPTAVSLFTIEIITPRPTEHWCVSEIRIREILFFGRWGKKLIR
jgi:hypothetical protein